MDSISRTNLDNDQEQEYHVGSGFVNKLRSKFAQLESSGNRIVLSKRSASVENLLTDTGKSTHEYGSRFRKRQGSTGETSNDDTIINSSKTSNVILRKPQGFSKKAERPNSYEGKSLIERPRSNESINKNFEKSYVSKPKETEHFKQNNFMRNVKPPLPKKIEIVSKRNSRNSSSDQPISIPKIEHHDWTIAPDLEKVARDDIIIIENTPVEKSTKTKEYSKDVVDQKPIKDKKEIEDELPKPHTVSAFRSFFEKANKAQDTLRVWQGHSPTRKSTGSDIGSPSVISPITSPRSSVDKVSDDYVFAQIAEKDSRSSASLTDSSLNKSSVNKTSPRNSAEFVPDIDTTPTSLEKSRQIFQTVEKSKESSVSKDSSLDKTCHKDTNKTKDTHLSGTHTLTPLHSISEVFDSRAIKKDKSNKIKPVVLARKSKEFTASNHVSGPKKQIPKDTIELKHEHDRQDFLRHDNISTNDSDFSKTKETIDINIVYNIKSGNEDVLNESLVKPSKKKSGKVSPRKTKIFDSANMKKKDRDPPKSPVSPVQSVFTFNDSSTGTMKTEVNTVNTINDTKDNKKETQMEVSDIPVRPARNKKPNNNKVINSGLTPLKTNIVKNDTKTHADTRSPRNNKPEPVFPEPKKIEEKIERVKLDSKTNADDSPVTGMSSFLANQLKKSGTDNSQLKTSSVHLANGSTPSPVPRKRQAPARPLENGYLTQSNDVEMKDKEQIPPELPKTPEPKLPVSNIDEIIKRKKTSSQPATKLVFDSSKIATKRKDPPKRKPPRKTLQELNENITFDSSPPVPKLDLSSITGEKQETEYQEGYIPTVIKPCNIKFTGEGVIPQKNPYKKTKTVKVKISFDDHATTTFEYEGEESALENYLQEHPDERAEVEKQEEEINILSQSTEELLNDSPRVPEPDMTTMKSNTVIAASGALTSYKSKMQTQEFQFGMSLEPEEPVYDRRELDDEVNDDSMQLLPADDGDLDAFSAEVGKADMLF